MTNTVDHSVLRDFAKLLLPQPGKQPPQILLGVVVSEEANGTITAYLSGADFAISGIRKLRMNTPVGGVVFILKNGPDYTVIGGVSDGNEWVSFTPTWTNVTLGTAPVNLGYYRRVGNFLEWKATLTLGTGGALTGTVSMSGPAGLVTAANDQVSAYGFVNDASTNHRWACTCNAGVSSNQWVSRIAANDTTVGFNATVPFTWAAGDGLWLGGSLVLA